jgi:two-component SAPR family response regulator
MKAELLKKDGPAHGIESVLHEAYDYYDSNKLVYTKTQTAFHLADYYFKTKNLQTSLKYLTEAINTSHEKEYVSFLQRVFEDFRYLFDFAIANNIRKDFIKILISSLLTKKNTDWISDESRKRFENLNSKIFDIKLKTFGKGEISIRNIQIDESEWTKKKWKTIFIYLLLSPQNELTKDKIIDLFFTDTPLESADNIFHQLVSKFRNLIKIEQLSEQRGKTGKQKKSPSGPALTPALVTYEDKHLKINRDINIYIDSNEFESLYKISSVEKDTDRRARYFKEAIAIYGGDFLDGNYETWAEELRVKYKNYFISMSEDLTVILFDEKKYSEALNFCEKLLKYDPLNLIAFEHLIKSYENQDKHTMARECYANLIKKYESEYGEKLPSSFTSKIAAVIG